MALSTSNKKEIVSKFARTQSDTGSPEVQVALISARIDELTEHFKDNEKDHPSRKKDLSRLAKKRWKNSTS